MANETVPAKIPVPTFQQLATFIPAPDMIKKMYNLFMRTEELTQDVIDLDIRVTALEDKAHGGLRKSATQAIGAMGAAFISIVNYQVSTFSDSPHITLNLANGTLSTDKEGNYLLIVSLEIDYTPDNNSSRKFKIRLFNVTDNIPVPGVDAFMYAGGYTAGTSAGFTIPFNISPGALGKLFRLEVGGGDTFAAVNILGATFSLVDV